MKDNLAHCLLLSLIVVVCSGCSPGFFHGRSLLVTHVPECLSSLYDGQGAALIDQGFRFWDDVGAQVRTDQSSPLSDSVIQVSINCDASIPTGDLALESSSPSDAVISVDVARLKNMSENLFRDAMAHEAGHMLGLGHEPDHDAVMYGGVHPADGINRTDKDQFDEMWGVNPATTMPE